MKASIIAASISLTGFASASLGNAHGSLHMRRGGYANNDVCTVYTTVYETALRSIVPNSTVSAQAVSTPCSEGVKTPVSTPVYTPAYTPVYSPSVPSVPSSKPVPVYSVASKPATSQAPPAYTPQAPSSKPAPKPQPTGGYASTGRIVTNGNKWAVTYTPYASDGNCKSADDIKADIKKISDLGFTTIRSYSTDCGVFEYVVPACQQYNLKVIYGIYLDANGKGPFSDYANAQLTDIKNNAPKDNVAMIIVGNECMFNNNCEPTQLASYIDYVRNELQSCGFPKDIAITTTEPVRTWEEKGAALCDHIDIFTVQVQPYFTSSVSADQAGNFALQQLEQAAQVCPGAAAKGKYITEIGWPSAGNPNGNAVASPQDQKTAMQAIMQKVGTEACLFSFQNDLWKHPGDLDVEQNFGCVDALY